MSPEVEVAIEPLPAHVDRVVLPGEAEPVAVDRPEVTVRRNRAGEGVHLARLGVDLRDSAGGDGKHLLLTSNQKAGSRGRAFADGDRNVVLVGDRLPGFVGEISHWRCGDALFDNPD